MKVYKNSSNHSRPIEIRCVCRSGAAATDVRMDTTDNDGTECYYKIAFPETIISRIKPTTKKRFFVAIVFYVDKT